MNMPTNTILMVLLFLVFSTVVFAEEIQQQSNYQTAFQNPQHLFHSISELDQTGGPDDFGHIYTDSDEDNGPEFDWIDISEDGTEITGMEDDNFQGPYELPWTFNFYGNEYDEVYVCSNGYLMFGGGSAESDNQQFPDDDDPNNIIAFYWDDLDPSEGSVYYGEDEDGNWICQFEGVPNLEVDQDVTAEVILFESGDIKFQYDEAPARDDSMNIDFETVGLENADGDDGLQASGDWWSYAREGLAVMFSVAEYNTQVEGIITDASNGDPVSDADISFFYLDGGQFEFTATTDLNGFYSLDEMFQGNYAVWISAEGYADYIDQNMAFEEGENTYDAELSSPAAIELDPENITLNAPSGGEDTEIMTISNVGGAELQYFIFDRDSIQGGWLTISPMEGMVQPEEFDEIEFSGDASNLETGEYQETIFLFCTDPENDFIQITVSFSVTANPPPEFDLMSPEDGSSNALGDITFEWEEAEDPDWDFEAVYDLYVFTDPDDRGTPVLRNLDEPLGIYEVDEDGIYYWTVRARSNENDGTWANSTFSFDAGFDSPAQFDLLSPVDESEHVPGNITLNWEEAIDPDMGDAVVYDIYISTDPDNMDDPFETSLNETSYNFNANYLATYYWTIHARDRNTNGTWSVSTWSFTVSELDAEETQSIGVPTQFAVTKIYPNPFNPVVNVVVAVPEASLVQAEIYNVLGQKIAVLQPGHLQPGYHNMSWRPEGPSGIYFIKVSSTSGWSELRKMIYMK
ncbi:MAG: carboxypeptidase regulatory-like domain-containing protein [Candidatus Electryonea clarkiae]|nr:carboxypeptidase regulatory-like domain-containing protein [Candidatus Electryonea clarkiae]MDP8285469.1 carboxypeptidase regulatory-like domain-containing protein [Candidatus Electryonea clarkiae]